MSGQARRVGDSPIRLATSIPFGYNDGPRCTPLLTTDRCYTFGAEGLLLCLDLANGKVIWHRETQKDFEVPEAFFGVGSSPILEEGMLIVQVGAQPELMRRGVRCCDGQDHLGERR
jgi:hypothetical protein